MPRNHFESRDRSEKPDLAERNTGNPPVKHEDRNDGDQDADPRKQPAIPIELNVSDFEKGDSPQIS
jgi:hypothetical protein